MIQAKTISEQDVLNQHTKILAYAHAYAKELSKDGSMYVLKVGSKVTLKTTSVEEAVNEYNLID